MTNDLPTQSDGCVELEQWPDALIRAVATEAPELFRSGDLFAYREQDIVGYARGMVLHYLEEEDLGFVNLEAYAADLSEDSFRRLTVEGEQWFVIDWKNSKPDQVIEALPRSENSILVDQWSDQLIAAVGAQAPALLRTHEGDAWALSETEFHVFASYWLFEGHCDTTLYAHVDLARYTEELRATFTEIELAGKKWYLHEGEALVSLPSGKESDRYPLLEWSDELIGVVAAELPQVFRTSCYEMILAVPADHIATVLADWAWGLTGEVEREGSLAAWSERVLREDFRPVELDGQRFWIYLTDWPGSDTPASS